MSEPLTMASPREPKVELKTLLAQALTVPGSMGNVYTRFHEYSLYNQALLLYQGVHEPVASYKRWQQLGRQVMRGSVGKYILRPLFVERKNEDGELVQVLTGFKPVRGAFAYSQTEGPELELPAIPGWDKETALQNLGIRQVPFESVDGNLQGYSRAREIAINPMAKQPDRTLFHEIGHVVLGHTMGLRLAAVGYHRGVTEAQAELTALLAMKETGQSTEETDSHSRGYAQHWLGGNELPERAIPPIFSAADRIVKAGRTALVGAVAYDPNVPANPAD